MKGVFIGQHVLLFRDMFLVKVEDFKVPARLLSKLLLHGISGFDAQRSGTGEGEGAALVIDGGSPLDADALW